MMDNLSDVLSTEDNALIIAQVPYAQYLGMLMRRREEQLSFTMPYQEKLLGNPTTPSLHGGVIAGFMENAALIDVLIHQQQSRIPKPIDFSIDYLRPGKPHDCYAEVDVVREGKRIVLARVDCWQSARDKLIAQARVHFLLEMHEPKADMESV